ncbi:MAG: hypothetical protein IJ574_04585 [Bacilli bacterium]|nr:hypothetical protein [Bacilli bacterium]
MDDRTIALYLTILLFFVIILYWLSNRVSYRLSKSKKNNTVKKQDIVKDEYNSNYNSNKELEINTYNNVVNNYPEINHTLSIYDIVENKNPEYIIPEDIHKDELIINNDIKEIKIDPLVTTDNIEPKEEVIEQNDIQNDFYFDNGSFVIGEAVEPIVEHEPIIEPIPETKIVEEKAEPVERKSSSNLSSILIAASVIIPGLKHKLFKNSIKYINYKVRTPNKFMVGQDVSLNNSKCAYHEYDLLPDWLKDLIDRENYKILISNNDKVTSKGAALFSPMESNKDIRYLAFSGKDEQEIEESFLVGVGHFVDNYLGTLADAPKDENGVKFFSSNSREWTKLYEENKEELNEKEIDSPSTYFSNTFKEFVTDKDNLIKNNPEAFKYMNKCMKVLEFHYQKDLVEDKCVNLEDYKENGNTKKSPIIENDLQLINNNYYNIYDEYEQNDVKTR